MRNPSFSSLVALALSLGASVLGANARAAKPVALIFELQQNKVAPIVQKTAPTETVKEAEPAGIGLRAIRKAFQDEGVVDPMVFSTDSPTVARAMLETQVTLAPDAEPTEAERLKIAAACGANFVVTIGYSRTAVTNDPSLLESNASLGDRAPTLEMTATEVKSGKVASSGKLWQDRIRVDDNLSSSQTARRSGLSDAVNTAARTLVLRFLGTPALRELRRLTPSAEFLPRPVAPPTVAEPSEPDADPAKAADDARTRAESILKDSNLEEGIRSLRRAVSLLPLSLSIRLSLARAYVQAKRPDRAEDEARRALELGLSDDPASRAALIELLAATKQASGDSEGAEETYKIILATDPGNAAASLALGEIYLGRGELDSAEPLLKAAAERKPAPPSALLGLARIAALRGNIDDALPYLAAPEIDPAARAALGSSLFLDASMRIALRFNQNRAGFESKTLERETFLKTVEAQRRRAVGMQKLLAAAAPPASASAEILAARKHHQLAASLLVQSLTNMESYLKDGKPEAAAQSRLYLGEFFNELREAAAPG